jgi:hypothetical protein
MDDQTKLVSSQEVAKMLGYTPGSLRTMRCNGVFNVPHYKIGAKVMYRLDDVQKYIDSCYRTETKRGQNEHI